MKSRTVHGTEHQYVDRETGRVLTERPFADWIVSQLYCSGREEPSMLFRLLTSRRFTGFLGWANYDFPLGVKLSRIEAFLHRCKIDLDEILDPADDLNSARKIFERRIRYWECRPMDTIPESVVCPADSRLLLGSFKDTARLFVKEKFFDYEEILGKRRLRWLATFRNGDYLICRLTPDKYHYNHTPAAGIVLDIYEINGGYHSCNPNAVITLATPYSKNKRVVTILDTDCVGGTGVGLIAMVEVVALMIGDIVQCYSDSQYLAPRPLRPGMHLRKGSPKSLYRPGSSTTILLFQRDRVEFAHDLIQNTHRTDVASRFSLGFGRPLVETDVKVRATIGIRRT
jgi:phosphatidylserine decarboxylase